MSMQTVRRGRGDAAHRPGNRGNTGDFRGYGRASYIVLETEETPDIWLDSDAQNGAMREGAVCSYLQAPHVQKHPWHPVSLNPCQHAAGTITCIAHEDTDVLSRMCLGVPGMAPSAGVSAAKAVSPNRCHYQQQRSQLRKSCFVPIVRVVLHTLLTPRECMARLDMPKIYE